MMNRQNHITLPKEPDKSLVSNISCRESHAGAPDLSSHHVKRTCDNYNTKEASNSIFCRSLPLFKKLVTRFSVIERSSSKESTRSCSHTSPAAQYSLESFSLHKISNDNISQFKEPTKPKLSHRRHPSKLIFESQSPVNKPNKSTRRNINAQKSRINSYTSKARQFSAVELTPLSQLIQQSYRDIEMLRSVYTAQNPGVEDKKCNVPELNLARNIKLEDEKDKEIDFGRVEANLKRFEGLYAQFLNSDHNGCNMANEVYLVAMVCKRSEVITGFRQAPLQSLPRTQDC